LLFNFDIGPEDYTPASTVTLFNTITGNSGCAVQIVASTGVIRFRVGDGVSITDVDSTVGLTITDLVRGRFGVVWSDGVGASFTQNGVGLGVPVPAAKTLAYSATTATIGPFGGRIYSITEISSGYAFSPATAAKLAGSVISGGSTWTINATGDLGARICGERDLYQATGGKMPALSTVNGINIATFDGSNDYMKAAAFALSQPETVYFVGSQPTWANGAYVCDGSVTNSGVIAKLTTTPQIIINAGSSVASNAEWILNVRAVLMAQFNASNSSLRVNKGTPTTGNPGSANMNGFTLAAIGSTGLSNSNVTFAEALIRSSADSASLQLRIISALMRTFQIPG